MPKPMLHKQEKNLFVQKDLLSLNCSEQFTSNEKQTDPLIIYRILRKNRSQAYIDALCHLDAGGHTQNTEQITKILDVIHTELPEVELSGILLGYISICHLGEPFEVHTIDLVSNIVEHYKRGQPLPSGMEKARSLAMRGGYALVEVYTDCCRAVKSNGEVAVIPC